MSVVDMNDTMEVHSDVEVLVVDERLYELCVAYLGELQEMHELKQTCLSIYLL